MKSSILEIFYALLLIDLLGLIIFTPILMIFSRRYSKSLNRLIKELPEPGFKKLKEQSKEGINSIEAYLRENLKAQFKQPDYLVNLITSEDFDSFGVKNYREECYKNYRTYKNLFIINFMLFIFLGLSALGMWTIGIISLFSSLVYSYELPRKQCIPDAIAAEKVSFTMLQIQFPTTNDERSDSYVYKSEDLDDRVRVEVSKKCPSGLNCKVRAFRMNLKKKDCSLLDFTLKM